MIIKQDGGWQVVFAPKISIASGNIRKEFVVFAPLCLKPCNIVAKPTL
jgi:hypothetical protein